MNYLLGWRKCPTHFDVARRLGLYAPSVKVCKSPEHRQGGALTFNEQEAATVPLTENDREDLFVRLVGEELYGVIESGDTDAIKDAVAKRLTEIGEVVRNEIWEFPEFETRPNAAGNGTEVLIWSPAE